MSKYIAVVVALAVVGWAFFNNLKPISSPRPLSFSLPSFKVPTLENTAAGVLAWAAWEEYVEAARAHDLAKVKALSHQVSAVCNDPERVEECFALMDGVYFFAQSFSAAEFKHVEADAKQIIMYTDGPERKILYFTRDISGASKVLGLRFCLDVEDETQESCTEGNVDTKDDDGDGWWNSTESLFR